MRIIQIRMSDVGYSGLDLLEQRIRNVILPLKTGYNSALHPGEIIGGKTGSDCNVGEHFPRTVKIATG